MTDSTALSVVVERAGGVMLPADPTGRYTHRFQIKSESVGRDGRGRLYTVAWDTATRQWCCGCPGWITRRRCKHMAAMAPGLASVANTSSSRPASLPGPEGRS